MGFPGTISIRENCYIDNNVSRMPGLHIGNNVIVGHQEYLEKKKDKYILSPSDPEGKKKYLLNYFKRREL